MAWNFSIFQQNFTPYSFGGHDLTHDKCLSPYNTIDSDRTPYVTLSEMGIYHTFYTESSRVRATFDLWLRFSSLVWLPHFILY